jgi:hypothetical protein
MTEQEWLDCTNPKPMLEFLRGKASDRKLRLFACACCRRNWQGINGTAIAHPLETNERYADGLATDNELILAREAARCAAPGHPYPIDPRSC